MGFLKDMLSESSNASAIRGMAFESLTFGGIIALYGMYLKLPLVELSILSGTFVGAAFTGKVLQKRHEKKEKTSIEEPKA